MRYLHLFEMLPVLGLAVLGCDTGSLVAAKTGLLHNLGCSLKVTDVSKSAGGS